MLRAIKGDDEASSYSCTVGKPSRAEAKLQKTIIASSPCFRILLDQQTGAKFLHYRTAIMTGVIGVVDELYQGLLPARCFIWYDILLNGLGGFIGLTIASGMSRK